LERLRQFINAVEVAAVSAKRSKTKGNAASRALDHVLLALFVGGANACHALAVSCRCQLLVGGMLDHMVCFCEVGLEPNVLE
jgi:hypothetical protein